MWRFLIRFFRMFLYWNKPLQYGQLAHAQLITVQAMSDLIDYSSSPTNKVLADVSKSYQDDLNLQIFAQAEVGKILNLRGITTVGNTTSDSKTNQASHKYLGTYGVCALQQKFCIERTINTVLVIAPYPHVWRVIWVFEQLGIKVVVPSDLPKMQFDKNLSQRRWRHSLTAYPYEFCARLVYFCKGYI